MAEAHDRAALPPTFFWLRSDFFKNEPEQLRHQQSSHQEKKHPCVHGVRNVPRVPLHAERPHQVHAVAVQQVEQQMNSRANCASNQRGKNSDGEFRIFASGKPETRGDCCDERNGSKQRMRCRAVATEKCACPAETGDPIHIGRQARNEQYRRGHPSYFVQPGASESDRSERMGHWFHEKGLNLAGVVVGSGLWLEPARTEVARRVKYYNGSGMASVSASGTMRNSAGRRPAGSPSTWISTGEESRATHCREVALQNCTCRAPRNWPVQIRGI